MSVGVDVKQCLTKVCVCRLLLCACDMSVSVSRVLLRLGLTLSVVCS